VAILRFLATTAFRMALGLWFLLSYYQVRWMVLGLNHVFVTGFSWSREELLLLTIGHALLGLVLASVFWKRRTMESSWLPQAVLAVSVWLLSLFLVTVSVLHGHDVLERDSRFQGVVLAIVAFLAVRGAYVALMGRTALRDDVDDCWGRTAIGLFGTSGFAIVLGIHLSTSPALDGGVPSERRLAAAVGTRYSDSFAGVSPWNPVATQMPGLGTEAKTQLALWDFDTANSDYVEVRVDGNALGPGFRISHVPREWEIFHDWTRIEVRGLAADLGEIHFALKVPGNDSIWLNSVRVGQTCTWTHQR